jgi:hypothetical protein
MIIGVGFGTVKAYLDASRYKLHASNVTHAVAIALALGLIDMGEDPVPPFPAIKPQPNWPKEIRYG